jgi:hypothetical protein
MQPSSIDFLASLTSGDPYFKSSLSNVPEKHTLPDIMRQSTSEEEERILMETKPPAFPETQGSLSCWQELSIRGYPGKLGVPG